MATTYTNTGALMFGEIVDIRDIIDRFEALEDECDGRPIAPSW
jgi:hypothetical protein